MRLISATFFAGALFAVAAVSAVSAEPSAACGVPASHCGIDYATAEAVPGAAGSEAAAESSALQKRSIGMAVGNALHVAKAVIAATPVGAGAKILKKSAKKMASAAKQKFRRPI